MSQSSDNESLSSSISYSSPHPSQNRIDYDNELIKVYLRAIGTLSVIVRRSDTVRLIKQQLFARLGISVTLPVLFFNNRVLEDDHTISYYGLDHESTIYIDLPFLQKLYVRIPSKKPINYVSRIYASLTDTVGAVKSLILHKEKIESRPDEYDLLYDGRYLRDTQTLAAENVPNDATLLLVPMPKDSLSIFVSTPFQGINSMRVKTSSNIGNMRLAIASFTNSEVEDSRLYKDATWLRDSRTIGSYNVKHNDVIEFKAMISIHVHLWTYEILTIRVWPSDDSKEVTCKVLEKLRKPFRVHPLMLNGQVLDEGQPIVAFGIRGGSTLTMGEAVQN